MKVGYQDNIERATLENDDFRRVLYTGHNLLYRSQSSTCFNDDSTR